MTIRVILKPQQRKEMVNQHTTRMTKRCCVICGAAILLLSLVFAIQCGCLNLRTMMIMKGGNLRTNNEVEYKITQIHQFVRDMQFEWTYLKPAHKRVTYILKGVKDAIDSMDHFNSSEPDYVINLYNWLHTLRSDVRIIAHSPIETTNLECSEFDLLGDEKCLQQEILEGYLLKLQDWMGCYRHALSEMKYDMFAD